MIFEVKNLTKVFQAKALDDVSFGIAPGESVALVGANGAGKSTLIKILLGLMFPTSGEVSVMGYPAGSPEALRAIGYLPEMPGYWGDLSAVELLQAMGTFRGVSKSNIETRTDKLLRVLGLRVRGSRRMNGYSKGMLQRSGVAAALLHDPEVIILDEPMSGLDPRAQEKFRQLLLKLRERGKTFLVSSHSLEDIRTLCSRVIVLEKSKLVLDGPTQDVLGKLLEKYRSSEPWDEDPLGEIPEDWNL